MNITRPMLEELLALTVPGDDEDEPVELTLLHMQDGPEGPGIYAYYSEHPEEGVTLIDGKSEVLRAEGRASVAGVPAALTDEQLDEFIRKSRRGEPPVGNHWKIDTAHGMTSYDMRALLRDFLSHGLGGTDGR